MSEQASPPAIISRDAHDQDFVPPDVFAGVSRCDVEVVAHFLERGSLEPSALRSRVAAMLRRLAPRIAGPARR